MENDCIIMSLAVLLHNSSPAVNETGSGVVWGFFGSLSLDDKLFHSVAILHEPIYRYA